MSEYGFRYTQDYLKHHGIEGQKWHHRRFQNKDGSLTTEGRIRYGVGKSREEAAKEKLKQQKKEEKTQKKLEKTQKKEAAIKAKQEAKQEAKEIKRYGRKIPDYTKMTEEERKAAREKALQTANVKEISKNIQHFSKADLDNVYNLIQSRKKITDLTKENVKTGEQKIRELANKMGDIAKLTKSLGEIYNDVAKASNSFLETDLPIIGEKKPGQSGNQQQNSNQSQNKSKGGLAAALVKAVNTNPNADKDKDKNKDKK